MIANLEQFQPMILQKGGNSETCILQIVGKIIETTNSLKLLVI